MFFWEASCVIPQDKKQYRRADLIVVKNNRAVVVEVDGSSHFDELQRRDDNKRDALISKHFSNILRLTHKEVQEDTEYCYERIINQLDPGLGTVR